MFFKMPSDIAENVIRMVSSFIENKIMAVIFFFFNIKNKSPSNLEARIA